MKIDSQGVDKLPLSTKIFTWICLAWALLISLVPIVWLVLSSFKIDPLARPGFMLPDSIYLKGYISTFRDLNVMRYFGNSMLISIVSVFVSIMTISMSAYVVARMEFKGKKLVNIALASTLFIPTTALTYPVYNLINRLGIYNTRSALILIYSCSGIAVSFFVIKNYYDNVPKELEEAEELTAGLCPDLVANYTPYCASWYSDCRCLSALTNWNEYYWASLVIIDRDKLTVPAVLSTFTTAFTTNYNGLFSAMVVIILPPIILYCVFNKFFIEALSGGAVKG